MATSGQTLNDRINAARYAIAGQGLARYVCKATTEEVIGPKKKHLDYLIACTHEANVSIPQMANLLIERTNHVSWVVVFKALVTVHHLMAYGNERLIQYLASSNYSFELSTFLDKTSARDFSMSTFIRRYSRYINEKALSYRLLAFDFCKIKRGNEGVLRQMPIDRLLKTLPVLQNQLDALLEFDCTVNDLHNGVIISCFMLLFRDLISLFACHNDGIINLLNKYFTLNKKMCREAFDLYKKFLVRMDKVNDFLRVAEAVGLDKEDIPDLRRAPSSLIDALEQHLQNLESNRRAQKSSNSSANSSGLNKTEFSSVLGSLTPPSNSSTARSSSPTSANSTGGASKSGSKIIEEQLKISNFKDDEVRRALEEEARVLSLYGSTGEGLGKSNKSSTNSGNLRFSSTTTGQGAAKVTAHTTPKTIDDIFGDANSFANVSNNNNRSSFSNSNETSATFNFDTPSGATRSDEKNQHALSKPDLDSIRSAIRSATTTLEQVNSKSTRSSSNVGAKKASDDLFSLLDPAPSNESVAKGLGNSKSTDQATNPISPFAIVNSPFDLPPPANGLVGSSLGGLSQANSTTVGMKAGNPFPEVGSAFSIASNAPITLQAGKSNTSAVGGIGIAQAPNYTSLAGIEGFGDVLQPTSTRGANGHTASSTKNSFANSSNLPGSGLFKGDLDSTLANLAQNLTFEGLSKGKK